MRVILNAVKPPRQVAPSSSRLRAPPLPLQRESILPEVWLAAEYINKKIEI